MNLFRHLMKEAQFHGSNRLTERKYRKWWAVSLALLIWAACSITYATIQRFVENPAYIVITETPEMKTKFPSVALCPEIKFPKYKIDAFLSESKYPPGLKEDDIKAIIHQLTAFYSPDVVYTTEDLRTLEFFLDYNHRSVAYATTVLSANCEESLLRCRLFGAMVNCSDIFKEYITSFGMCCIFNGRSLRREIRRYGIHKAKAPPTIYNEGLGYSSGLMFVVNSSQELDDVDLTYKWLYLDKGQQYAEVGRNGSPILPNQEYWVAYVTKKFLIEESSNHLSEEIRNCRWTSEKLQYFPNYDRQNCILECEMKHVMRRCQCVKSTHPRPPNWNYCSAKSLLCAKNAIEAAAGNCDCPSNCDITFDLYHVRDVPLIPGNHTLDPIYDDLDFSKVTILRTFIVEHDNRVYVRRSYYTSENLFSQIGGIMNVFFGCSILTILELLQLFWYGIRQYWIVKRSQKQRSKVAQLKSPAKKIIIKKKEVNKKKVNKKKIVRFRKRW